MKVGDLYQFKIEECLPIMTNLTIIGDAIGIFLKQEWDGDSKIYEFYFPRHNQRFWFRQSELNYAKRLTRENR